jgi:hypothetical protein
MIVASDFLGITLCGALQMRSESEASSRHQPEERASETARRWPQNCSLGRGRRNDFFNPVPPKATHGARRPFKNILKKMKKTLVRGGFLLNSHRQT